MFGYRRLLHSPTSDCPTVKGCRRGTMDCLLCSGGIGHVHVGSAEGGEQGNPDQVALCICPCNYLFECVYYVMFI